MAMAGYTKLFNSILMSTIWREDDKTRIVWITLLAMADKNGIAETSIPSLADAARVSGAIVQALEVALAIGRSRAALRQEKRRVAGDSGQHQEGQR